ncbi:MULTISPECIES: rhodanese-like domain-containing protein, partial [unclassified Aeromonas]|uniref:rhodanese-like domain-containing protein n=1 Tax=unclassified Aeromonas TaxID=257493 RepID=UPI0022DF8731
MWIRTWILTGILFSCLSVSAKEWLIDVRTAEEYLAEHVSGAMNIEYHRIVHEVANLGIRKYDSIQLYCRSGALLHNSKAGQQSLRRRFRSVDLLS